MKKSLLKLEIFLSSLFFPAVTLAAPRNFSDLLRLFVSIVQNATTLVAGLALLAFFWGLARFIYNSNDATAVREGKQIMVWGVAGLFIMLSIAGILNLLSNTFFP